MSVFYYQLPIAYLSYSFVVPGVGEITSLLITPPFAVDVQRYENPADAIFSVASQLEHKQQTPAPAADEKIPPAFEEKKQPQQAQLQSQPTEGKGAGDIMSVLATFSVISVRFNPCPTHHAVTLKLDVVGDIANNLQHSYLECQGCQCFPGLFDLCTRNWPPASPAPALRWPVLRVQAAARPFHLRLRGPWRWTDRRPADHASPACRPGSL